MYCSAASNSPAACVRTTPSDPPSLRFSYGCFNPDSFCDSDRRSDVDLLVVEIRSLLINFEYRLLEGGKILSFGKIGPYVGRQQQITENPS